MARLTMSEAEALRHRLVVNAQHWRGDFMTASQWQSSGFSDFTTAQVKRQLEVLVGQGKIKVHRGWPGVTYGLPEETL